MRTVWLLRKKLGVLLLGVLVLRALLFGSLSGLLTCGNSHIRLCCNCLPGGSYVVFFGYDLFPE